MKTLALTDILAIDDLPVTQVTIPQWAGTVGVRTMRAKERAEIEAMALADVGKKDPSLFRREMLRRCCVGPDGKPLLPDDASAKLLMDKSAPAVEVLFEAAVRVNGIGQKDIEELEKN